MSVAVRAVLDEQPPAAQVPEDERSYGDVAFPRYSTTADVARWAGVDVRWVQRQVRRGVAAPVLFRGERQFDRAGVIRLLLLARLQQMLGESSPLPFQLVEVAGPAIDDLLRNPDAGTVLTLTEGGRLNIVVGVPRLKELLAAARA